MIFERTTFIPAPLEEVFRFFADPPNLGRLTPPQQHFRIINGPSRPLREGDRINYAFRVFGVPMRWRARIQGWREGESFQDFQERGPFRYWLHTHSFRAVEGGTEMHDFVEYELPFGGVLVAPLIRRQLERIFDYRTRAVRNVIPSVARDLGGESAR